MDKPDNPSRRKFVTDVGLAAAALTIVPRHVLGRGFTAPSDTFNVAACGVGGMGRSNLVNLSTENIVALCDVDWGYASRTFDAIDREIAGAKKRLEDGYVEFRAPT